MAAALVGWKVADLVDGWADWKALAMVDLKGKRWVVTSAMMLGIWKASQMADWTDET